MIGALDVPTTESLARPRKSGRFIIACARCLTMVTNSMRGGRVVSGTWGSCQVLSSALSVPVGGRTRARSSVPTVRHLVAVSSIERCRCGRKN